MATTKEALAASQKALGEFFELANYLFNDDAPYNVNEIPTDHKFYPLAKGLADDLGIDWENMSHEDSNRMMLNLLSESFYEIKPIEGYKPTLTITFKED